MCENTDSRCTTTVTARGTRLAGVSSRFLCLSFFAAAKKVSAAPHRGNANRPISIQGKAKTVGKQTNKAPRRLTDQGKANAAGTETKQAPRRQKRPSTRYAHKSLCPQTLTPDVQALSTGLSTKSVDKPLRRDTPIAARSAVNHPCIHPHRVQQTDLHQALNRVAP
jgi:hypothetical protein